MDAMVVVEPNDRVISPGFAVVERVLDALGKLLGLGHCEHANTGNGTVRVGFCLVANDRDVIRHSLLLVYTLTR